MWWYVLIFVCIYLAIGVAMMFMLLQTPYAENPKWAMVLLWPLYVISM